MCLVLHRERATDLLEFLGLGGEEGQSEPQYCGRTSGLLPRASRGGSRGREFRRRRNPIARRQRPGSPVREHPGSSIFAGVAGDVPKQVSTCSRDVQEVPREPRYLASRHARARVSAPEGTAVRRVLEDRSWRYCTEAPTPGEQRSDSNFIVYPFPIRKGVVASLSLPADMTTSEAKRLGSFIATLAIDEQRLLTAGAPSVERS